MNRLFSFLFFTLFFSQGLTAQNVSNTRLSGTIDDSLTVEVFHLVEPAAITEKEDPALYRHMSWEAVVHPDSAVEKRYEKYEQAIMLKPAVYYYEVTAPVFSVEVKRLRVKLPKKRKRKFKKVTQRILVKPEHVKYVSTPPVFKMTRKERLVKQASRDVEAVYEKYPFKMLVTEASYITETIPAEYLEVTYYVLKKRKKR